MNFLLRFFEILGWMFLAATMCLGVWAKVRRFNQWRRARAK
jgi:preprotein translocase subunit SecG